MCLIPLDLGQHLAIERINISAVNKRFILTGINEGYDSLRTGFATMCVLTKHLIFKALWVSEFQVKELRSVFGK